jgi:hypothetical protein
MISGRGGWVGWVGVYCWAADCCRTWQYRCKKPRQFLWYCTKKDQRGCLPSVLYGNENDVVDYIFVVRKKEEEKPFRAIVQYHSVVIIIICRDDPL